MSKALGGSVPGLCVKSSTSSSEVEGWVRMIRGIYPMIARERHWGERRKKNRLMFHKTKKLVFLLFIFTAVFPSLLQQRTKDERRKNGLTAIVCFSLCRKSPTFRSENDLFGSLPKPNSCTKREEKEFLLEALYFSIPRLRLRHSAKAMREFKISSLRGDLVELPTTPLPLQKFASVFLDGGSSALSAVGLHSCRSTSSCWSWGSPGSDVLSLSTVILMLLPAFLRALTASWWVAPCTLRPLTWMECGHVSTFMAGEKCKLLRPGGKDRECFNWHRFARGVKVQSDFQP